MCAVDRREFCLGLGALSAALTVPGLAADVKAKRPNIVFILADDMGWGDLDSYNSRSAIPTPNANRLAAQGMRFTDMHAASAICTPSRYSILTGRYCWRSELKKGGIEADHPNLIEPGRMTVASMLKSAGYYTAGVGKWHLGLGNKPKTDFTKPLTPGPNDHGFDYYFGIPASANMEPFLYFENDHVVESATAHNEAGPGPFGAVWQSGPIAPHFVMEQVLPTINEKAVSIIHERAATPDQPFFLYLAYPAPHNPWFPLPEYQGKSRAGKYGDYVVEVDDMLGKVMQALDQNGLSENTLVILTSDNGADWRLDNAARYEHQANGDWRGEKADIWEAGHRIPFIARWPSHIRPGSVSDQLGCLSDFMATTAAIVGSPLPANAAEDSFNLLPVLLGKAKKPVRESIIDHSMDGMFAMREGNWKLELGLGAGGFVTLPIRVEPAPGGPAGQLYDLAVDPYERHNVYQERPDIVAHLSKLLEKYQQQGYTRPM